MMKVPLSNYGAHRHPLHINEVLSRAPVNIDGQYLRPTQIGYVIVDVP
jgi:hypothetical protein